MVSAYPLSGLENHRIWSELLARAGSPHGLALEKWLRQIFGGLVSLHHENTSNTHGGPNISPHGSVLTLFSNEAVATEHPRKPQLQKNHGKMIFPLARPPLEGWWQCQDLSAEILNAISSSEQIQ